MIIDLPEEHKEKIQELQNELNSIYTVASNGDYGNDAIADKLLFESKTICYGYLNDDNSIVDLSNEDLMLLYEFTMLKCNYLNAVKSALQLEETNMFGFVELGATLDNYNDCTSLSDDYTEALYIKLSKDINFVLEQLMFCYSVFNKIVKQRKIFKQ